MKLSDVSNQRNRPVSHCYSLGQHMLAGCYTSDIGPCVEEGGKKEKRQRQWKNWFEHKLLQKVI